MKILKALLFSALATTAFANTASAGQSIWNHNGSQMLLQSNGSERTISYLYPRPGISAKSGQVLFQGRRVGNQYVGTAYTFRRGCRPAPYEVSGRLGSETRIVLHGASPRRSGCRVIGYTNRSGNSRLVFSYMKKAGPDVYGTEANEPPADPQYNEQPQYNQPQYNNQPQAQPQHEGPVNVPPQYIVKRIPGGKVTFKIQDQDAPAETPIRIDVTAQCNNGRQVRALTNHRTCKFLGLRTLPDGSGYDITKLDFGGGTCSVGRVERLQTYALCE